MRKLLTLSYKGAREYLHGSDFFNILTDIAAEVTNHPDAFVDRLTFRHFARMACEVTTEQPADLSKAIGQVRFRLPHDSSHLDAWLVETDISVTARRPFDEALLLANASLDESERSARIHDRSVYTPIEDVIALTKHLNYAVSPDVVGKWVFGQLDLTEPLIDSYQMLEIQMKSLIAGRFSVNDILVDGRRIGSMRFIVGAP
jgi:hypothetical protein